VARGDVRVEGEALAVAGEQQSDLAHRDPVLAAVDGHPRRAGVDEHELDVVLAARTKGSAGRIGHRADADARREQAREEITFRQEEANRSRCPARIQRIR
jgi:hypothetical protein